MTDSHFNLDAFVQGYMVTVLGTASDESDESGGEPLGQTYDVADFTDEAKADMRADCANFVTQHAALLEEAVAQIGYDARAAGGDFWLTRQGHGVGFSDRAPLYDERTEDEQGQTLADRLDQAAHAYGEHHGEVMALEDEIHYGTPQFILRQPREQASDVAAVLDSLAIPVTPARPRSRGLR